jgi:hypothetical protein
MSRVIPFLFFPITLSLSACAQPVVPAKKDVGTQDPHMIGEAGARAEIAKGNLYLLGAPDSKWPELHKDYVELLQEKCKVGFLYSTEKSSDGAVWARHVKFQQARVKAWNAVMTTEIQRQFGATILDDLQKLAQTRFEKHAKDKGK